MYNLRRPYDLVALLKQEERADTLEGLKRELLTRKEEIDKNEDKDTGKVNNLSFQTVIVMFVTDYPLWLQTINTNVTIASSSFIT